MTPQQPPPVAVPAFLRTLTLSFVWIAALFSLDTFLARIDRNESRSHAERLYREGLEMERQQHPADAADRFREAAYTVRGNSGYQLAFARALAASRKAGQAQAVLEDLLDREPLDGPANLAMARVLLGQARTTEAISYFHRAIYGQWPGNVLERRAEVRFELLDVLSRQNANQDMLAELLPLENEASADVVTQRRIAKLFLAAGSPQRAAGVFRRILRSDPRDAEALAGLGEADFARADYRQAQANFRAALRLTSQNEQARARLSLIEEILALDPLRRGLSPAETTLRSGKLLDLVAASLRECAGDSPSPLVREGLERATGLRTRRPKAGAAEAVSPLDLAEDLWKLRLKECPAPAGKSEEALGLVLSRVGR